MKAQTRILVALVGGLIAGVATHAILGAAIAEAIVRVVEPIGRLWLASLFMVVIPLVISTLSTGVAGLGGFRQLGRVGLVTILCFASFTLLSTLLGLSAMNLAQPGGGLSREVTEQLVRAYQETAGPSLAPAAPTFGVDFVMRLVPSNPVQAAANGDMLAIIFFSLMVGVALAGLPRDKAAPMLGWLDSLAQVTIAIIDLVMLAAPVGVACLIYSVTARFGLDLVLSLLGYLLTVLGAMALFQFLVFPLLLWLVARRPPRQFFRDIGVVMVTAFSTSSSAATLPTTIRIAEERLGVPRQIAGFVLPLGATLNMNGTALFEGATVLFIAQVFGVELSLGAQILVVGMSVITAIGVAGVPGGSIPLLMLVLSMVGVPMEGIAIVLGIDRLLDMCRTVLNVSGDLLTATVVVRFAPLADAAPSAQMLPDRQAK